MKATTASQLASLALYSLVSAFEVPLWEKMSLSDAHCEDINLTDSYILHARCVSVSSPSWDLNSPPKDISLDLNKCFANYMGTLNFVPDGGFGTSCPECTIDDKKNLVCKCGIGAGMGYKETTQGLNDWRIIRVAGLGNSEIEMSCHQDIGIQKRADDKEARPFVA
ncbi:hypothetical protein F4802DRAFT_601413 [Xylaria palmicola]|nr:hypothetical protein F4802DRAFT_601413 [Xylaria palmicola]